MKDKALIGLVGLGLLIVYLGIRFNVPAIIGLTVFGLGLFGLVSGAQMILTRRAHIPLSGGVDAPAERHTGLPAQLWGVLFLAFGACLILIALAVWLWPGGVTPSVERLLSTASGRAWLLIATGACITLYGAIRLIAGNAAYSKTGVTPLERLLSGIYFFLVGSGLVALGLLLLIAPAVLTALVEQVKVFIQHLVTG